MKKKNLPAIGRFLEKIDFILCGEKTGSTISKLSCFVNAKNVPSGGHSKAGSKNRCQLSVISVEDAAPSAPVKESGVRSQQSCMKKDQMLAPPLEGVL